jgi:polysaccharide biosynthesis PFTS motif protein
MRGYDILKKSNRLSLIDNVRNRITEQALNPSTKEITILKNEVAVRDHQVVIQQYLIEQLLTLSFNKSVLFTVATGKKLVYPLPSSWQNILSENDIKPNCFICTVLFYKYIFTNGLAGCAEFLWQTLRSFKRSIKVAYSDLGEYVFFEALQPSNLPDVSGDYEYGIVSTYVKKFPKPDLVDFVCHTVQQKSGLVINGKQTRAIPSPIPPLSFNINFFLFLAIGSRYFLMSLFDVFRGQWQTMLMLREKMKSLAFRFGSNNKKAKQFLFHNSGWIYRPLWTYVAENLGASIVFYFYSVNCERFKRDGRYPDRMTNSWAITTWPEYLVWDSYHADFVRRVIKRENKATVVGSVSFIHSSKKLEYSSERFISIFDVQPMRQTFYNTLAVDTEYYVPEVANSFLEDVIKTARNSGFSVIIKRKREIGKYINSEYRSKIESYGKLPDCVFVDPSIPAEEIIKKSILVISMPFTSTAILAKEFGKPGVYYDPSGVIEKEDRAAHGIKILSTIKELSAAFEKLKWSNYL